MRNGESVQSKMYSYRIQEQRIPELQPLREQKRMETRFGWELFIVLDAICPHFAKQRPKLQNEAIMPEKLRFSSVSWRLEDRLMIAIVPLPMGAGGTFNGLLAK